jgi:site-specific recombinase XerD
MPTTITAYSYLIHTFISYLNGKPLLTVTVEDMEGFVGRIKEDGKPLMAATQRRDAAALRSFYRWCHEQRFTDHNLGLALHTPTVHNKQPRSLPDDVWMRLWSHDQVQMRPQAVVALGLGFYCGLRRDEISKLRGDQITASQFVAFKRKGGGEDTLPWRTMFQVHVDELPSVVGAYPTFPIYLERLARSQGSEPLLGWSAPNSFSSALRYWVAATGSVNITPHQLRHSCATNLLRCGVPIHIVSALLNHSSIQTTMRYVRAGRDALAEWMDGKHGRDRGRGAASLGIGASLDGPELGEAAP